MSNACKSYSPPRNALKHSGVEPNPDYEFGNYLNKHMCLNKQMIPEGYGVGECLFPANPYECPLFQAKNDKHVLYEASNHDGTVKLQIITSLSPYNIREYELVRVNTESEDGTVIIKVMSEHSQHGEDTINKMLDALEEMREEMYEGFYGEVVKHPIEKNDEEEKASYFKKVLS